jgi:hypothetical protein
VKPLHLKPHEARELLKGSALIVRPVEPQPKIDAEGVAWSFVADKTSFQLWTDGHSPRFAPGSPLYEFCPLKPGSETWGREKHWRRGVHSRRVNPANTSQVWKSFSLRGQPYGEPIESVIRYEDPGPKFRLNWRERTAGQMPRWASRFPRLVVATSRVCRLLGLTIEERAATGNTAWLAIFEPRWTRDYPKFPAASDPWVWAAMVERRASPE